MFFRRARTKIFIENLLVRNHFIIEMIWWTGLAPWEFEPTATVGSTSSRWRWVLIPATISHLHLLIPQTRIPTTANVVATRCGRGHIWWSPTPADTPSDFRYRANMAHTRQILALTSMFKSLTPFKLFALGSEVD